MLLRITLFIVLILFLPLLGSALGGLSLAPRFQFPPLSPHTLYAGFSEPLFTLYLLLTLAPVGLALWSLCCRGRRAPDSRRSAPVPNRLAWWGWAGLATVGAGLGTGLAGYAPEGLFLLLSGLALGVDGLNRRRGATLAGRRPLYFLSLFALGALLWWLLEYLNRFAQIWYFSPGTSASGFEYALRSTLAFAPVPAAVMALQVWLGGLLGPRLRRGRALAAAPDQAAALALVTLAAIGLMAGALWPPLFGLTWTSPVLLLSALQLLWGRETFFCGIFQGNWSRVAASAAAGVTIGVVVAAAIALFDGQWHMALPRAQCCELLSVPLLGYAGFALLGILCMQLADGLAALLPGRARQEPPGRKPFPIPIKVE